MTDSSNKPLYDGLCTSAEWQKLSTPIAVLGIGAFEQHGAHLPLLTDTMDTEVIVKHVARELGAACLPVIPIGQSYEHSGFRGSLSFRPETIMAIVRDLADELQRQHFTRLILISGHGGNFALPTVVRDINRMDRPIKILLFSWGEWDTSGHRAAATADGEVHAGMWETSVVMALFPDRVGTPVAPPPDPLPEATRPDLNHYGLGILKPAGPWGDPTKAGAEIGQEILAATKENLVAEIRKRLRWLDENPRYAGTSQIVLRPMVAADIAAGERLCRLAAWNQQAADWRLFLDTSAAACIAAVHNGRVVATITGVSYDDQIGWLGMLLVDPEYRRQGIATRLLNHAIETLAGCDSIKLDATPAGKQVYDALGFVDEYRLSRMTIDSLPDVSTGDPAAVRPMTEADLDAVIELDATVFGARRDTLIRGLFALAPATAHVVTGDTGRIAGVVLGRPGENFSHVGPIAATDLPAARALACAAFRGLTGRPVVVDATDHDPRWQTWLASLGFVEQRPFIRMYKGANPHPGTPPRQFAICGPEWG